MVSLKGGSGKTTVALSLAFAARQAGLKVVVADIDPRRSAAELLRDRPEAASMLIETRAAKLGILLDACRASGCDLLIVDTPPAPVGDVAAAADVADLSLVVTRPGMIDLAPTMRTTRLLRRAGARAAVLLNNCPSRRTSNPGGLLGRALAALFFSGVPLAQTRLGRRPTYHQASASQGGVGEHDPWRAFAADVMALLGETAGGLLWANTAAAGPALAAGSAQAGSVEASPKAGQGVLNDLRRGLLADLTPQPAIEPPAAIEPSTIERWDRFGADPATDFSIPRQPWAGRRERPAVDWPSSAAA